MCFKRIVWTACLSVLLPAVSHCSTCLVGSNYKYSFIDSGTLDSQTCGNGEDYCVKMEGAATMEIVGPAGTGSYTIGFCTSSTCSDELNCTSSKPSQKLDSLKTDIESGVGKSFESTSCNLACCEGDDCNSASVGELNAISCAVGLSYAFHGTGRVSNALRSESCNVTDGKKSCVTVEEKISLRYQGKDTEDLIMKGFCYPTSGCNDVVNTCTSFVTPADILGLNALSDVTDLSKTGTCNANPCCRKNNCNDKSLEDTSDTTATPTSAITTREAMNGDSTTRRENLPDASTTLSGQRNVTSGSFGPRSKAKFIIALFIVSLFR